jgi:hypothetical protein
MHSRVLRCRAWPRLTYKPTTKWPNSADEKALEIFQGPIVFSVRRSATPVKLVDELGPDRLDLRLD